MKSVCLVDNGSDFLLNFRKHFIIELVKWFKVIVICPLRPGDKERLISIGVNECIDNTYLSRQGINPVAEFRLYNFYMDCFKNIGPDIVFNYTIKCSIWSSAAAHRQGVKKIYSMITGLGYAFTEVKQGGFKKRFVNGMVRILYKRTLKHNNKVFFLNHDDYRFFNELALIKKEQSTVLNGEGVDIDYFAQAQQVPSKPTFILLSRLLKDKGVFEYYQAAKLLKKRCGQGVVIKMAGSIDNNPASLTQDELEEIKNSGVVQYLGLLSDVREEIVKSSVLVLPSYREGLPRSILEAMSMGRAIITTDAPGCKDTVENGENGYLVPIKDVDALVSAMEKLIEDPDLVVKMGQKSREIAERKYDVDLVNQVMLDIIMA